MILTVVGLGSRSAGDDAVGLALVEALSETANRPKVVLLLWEDADALTLAHDLLQLPGPVIIVDCAEMGMDAGSWRFLPLEHDLLADHRGMISTHGLGMAAAIAMARDLGYDHPIYLFGVQPFDLAISPGLTPPMRQRLPAIQQGLFQAIDHLIPPIPAILPIPLIQTRIPLAIPLKRSVLAMGIETKNALALGRADEILLFQPLGDTADPSARTMLEEQTRRLLDGGDAAPKTIGVDLHPDMFPSVLGRRLAQERGLAVVAVQHHVAHAAACMAEHGLQESLALVFDGMGWGGDATLWGAELLHVRPGHGLRLGTFAPAPLPGGDAAVKNPYRQLLARWVDADVAIDPDWCATLGLSATEVQLWTHQCRHGLHAPLSHAAGRLFDAFAALLGIAPSVITCEGEPAMLLEAAAKRFVGDGSQVQRLPFSLRQENDLLLVDWRDLIRQFPGDHRWTQDEIAYWAMAFHHTMVDAMVQMVHHGHECTGLRSVVCSGGVFMNELVAVGLRVKLEQEGYRVFQHQRILPGDLSIAVGQAWMIGGEKSYVSGCADETHIRPWG